MLQNVDINNHQRYRNFEDMAQSILGFTTDIYSMVKATSSYRIAAHGREPSLTAQIDNSTIFQFFPADPLSFLSSRLSQFTKATRIFTSGGRCTYCLAAEFRQACDNIPNTLVIIKSGQYIAGGYTEVAWSSPSKYTFIRSHSMSAYLFSVNRQTIYPLKTKGKDIWPHRERGPIFGNDDIVVGGDYKKYGGASFLGHGNAHYDWLNAENPKELLFGKHQFTIDEY